MISIPRKNILQVRAVERDMGGATEIKFIEKHEKYYNDAWCTLFGLRYGPLPGRDVKK